MSQDPLCLTDYATQYPDMLGIYSDMNGFESKIYHRPFSLRYTVRFLQNTGLFYFLLVIFAGLGRRII